MTEIFTHVELIWIYGTSSKINENKDTLRRHIAYLFIQNMLTHEAFKAINQKSATYMISTFDDGPCPFKAIVVKV